MRDQIERAAAASGRSLTDEVESRLERTFTEDRMLGEDITETRIELYEDLYSGRKDLIAGAAALLALIPGITTKSAALALTAVATQLLAILERRERNQ